MTTTRWANGRYDLGSAVYDAAVNVRVDMKSSHTLQSGPLSLDSAGGAACSDTPEHARLHGPSTCRVLRMQERPEPDANWDKPAWQTIPSIELTHFMGTRPEHFPRTQARLAYDEQFIYVIFKVDDRYVRAVAPHHQANVCHDSCVEFFFTPGSDPAVGYFNLEMNCGGTMLFKSQLRSRKSFVLIKDSDLQCIAVAHTLPRIVEPEITEPRTWTLEYRVPHDLLTRYCSTAHMPGPGVTWRGNLYKCANKTSHPHSLTWAPVSNSTPNFHLPQYFGTLIFE